MSRSRITAGSDLAPIWRECFRVLRPAGLLLVGFSNPDIFIFDVEALDTVAVSRPPARPCGHQKRAATSASERTTEVPAAGVCPSSSPRTICTAAMPTATLPAQ
jgi:hypothetical protein